jgi:hypothetical protein
MGYESGEGDVFPTAYESERVAGIDLMQSMAIQINDRQLPTAGLMGDRFAAPGKRAELELIPYSCTGLPRIWNMLRICDAGI